MFSGHILCRAVGTVNALQCDYISSMVQIHGKAAIETVKEIAVNVAPQNKSFLFSVETVRALISMMQCKNKQANKQHEQFFVLMSCEKRCDAHFEKNVQRDWITN